MKLYDYAAAPSPRRVHIFLAEKGIDMPRVEIDLRSGEQLGEAFRQVNPDCTVPVLELDDGTHISEVFAICQYLDQVQPEPPLMGRNAVERALVTMWNGKIEQYGFMAFAESFRNRHKAFRGRALTGSLAFEQLPELADRGRKRGEAFLDRMNDHLENSEYVTGDSFTLADITAFVATEFAAWSKISIGDERPHLCRWFDTVSSRPSTRSNRAQ